MIKITSVRNDYTIDLVLLWVGNVIWMCNGNNPMCMGLQRAYGQARLLK